MNSSLHLNLFLSIVCTIVICVIIGFLCYIIGKSRIFKSLIKLWRRHIAFLLKYKKRRKIVMPFKNACLQLLYSLFYIALFFCLYLLIGVALIRNPRPVIDYIFIVGMIYLVAMFWHTSAIIGRTKEELQQELPQEPRKRRKRRRKRKKKKKKKNINKNFPLT